MIVITGAAGFIGSNLARRLSLLAVPLLLVDHPLIPARAGNIEDLAQYPFMDHRAFAAALERDAIDVGAIFHLGACSDTTEADWAFLFENNVDYSQRLWRFCARRNIPFIYASSAATYGDGSGGFDDRTAPERLHPLNLYGKSKNDFDRWVLDEVDRGDPAPRSWAGLKFFNVFGPHETHKGRMASMVYHAYRQIVERGEVGLFRSSDPTLADGEQRRDFVFVEDNIDHLMWLWRNPQICGIFNSGTGKARSFTDLVAATFRVLDREPRIRFIPMPDDLRGRYQNFTRAEMGKLHDAGYPGRPTPLEDGVARTVAWLERTHALATG